MKLSQWTLKRILKKKNKGDRVNTITSSNITDCYAEQTQIKEHGN